MAPATVTPHCAHAGLGNSRLLLIHDWAWWWIWCRSTFGPTQDCSYNKQLLIIALLDSFKSVPWDRLSLSSLLSQLWSWVSFWSSSYLLLLSMWQDSASADGSTADLPDLASASRKYQADSTTYWKRLTVNVLKDSVGWANEPHRHFSKEVQMANKGMENMFSTFSHQGNTNQSYGKILSQLSPRGGHWANNRCWWGWGSKGNLIQCRWECNVKGSEKLKTEAL